MASLVPGGAGRAEPAPMGQEQSGSHRSLGRLGVNDDLIYPLKTPCSLPGLRPSADTSARSQRTAAAVKLPLCLWLSLIRQTVCTLRSKGVVLVEADSTDHWSSPPRRTANRAAILSRLSSLSIRRRNLRTLPLNTRPTGRPVQRAAFFFYLLGSLLAAPAVFGSGTPAAGWMLGARLCFGSGTEFSL